jgi:hypothetical protein
MLRSLRVYLIYSFVVVSFYSVQSHAVLVPPPVEASPNEYFAPYGINSLMIKNTSNDDPSSEINISMRFFFKQEIQPTADGQPAKLEKASICGFNPFLSYTGRYDFYWLGTAKRNSAPVISRYQNPALHFRMDISKDWLDVGIEHFSNGQQFDASLNKQQVLDAYQTLDLEESRVLMDSISRVGASVALTFQYSHKLKLIRENSAIDIKWYAKRVGQEAEVFWGPYRSNNFNNFQKVSIGFNVPIDEVGGEYLPAQFNAITNIGTRGLSEDSWDFMLICPLDLPIFGKVPFAVTVHRGPMNNLSEYTKPQNTVAFGITTSY